jgi:DNA-binding NarL/FixJ family response regulator
MRVVALVNQEPFVEPLETFFRLGGMTDFAVSHDVDVTARHIAAGDVDVAITGRQNAKDLAAAVARGEVDVRSRTKFVLMTTAQNSELLQLAAELRFDGVIDVYLEPSVVHQLLRNIVMMGANWPGPVDSPASPDMLFLATRDSLDRTIIAQVALGLTDRQIATEIGLAPQTVRNRLSKIMGDAGLTNRTQLAHMWLREQSLMIRNSQSGSTPGESL